MSNEFYPLFFSFHFYLFSVIALVSAILFVTRQSPVAAALWLVNVMFCLAALYVMLDAQFIGAIQVLVYAGAIMVVFLFVVMLLNLGKPEDVSDIRGSLPRVTAGFVGAALLAEVMVLARASWNAQLTLPVQAGERIRDEPGGIIAPIADVLLRDQLLAFELSSILLLVAIVGAVTIGRKRT
jgi:NADH-quinone oxidoreductase subunit J